jgi:hypothetical protein
MSVQYKMFSFVVQVVPFNVYWEIRGLCYVIS